MKHSDTYAFNILFSGLGTLLLGVAGWVGANVSHIPAIEQKIELYNEAINKSLNNHEQRLNTIEHGFFYNSNIEDNNYEHIQND
jgi:hypothetical protein